MELYLANVISILDTYAPFKRVNKYKLRFKIKPWITPTFQKLIFVKKLLFNLLVPWNPLCGS